MKQQITEAEKRAIQAEDLPAFQGFKLLNLKTQIEEVLTQFGRNGLFEEYTKHDITHLAEMLRIYDWLIPESSKEVMSPADWLLLVCSTYLHDLGLIITRAEFANRANTGYAEYSEGILHTDDADSQDYKAYLKSLAPIERERFIYQEFVRANHAARIRSWLQERPDLTLGYDAVLGRELKSLLSGLEGVFVTDLGLVCESHHLDDLQDTSKYRVDRPYGNSSDETANVQYAAICLRAADLLHITRDRTPSIAFKLINPNNPDSQREWAKQRAVRAVRPQLGRNRDGDPDPNVPQDTVEVHAKFEDEEGYFGLTAYLKYAEKQLQQCYAWTANSYRKKAARVTFPWRYIDLSHIEASGFIPRQFDFTLDEGKILDLLTGHTLYNDSSVVIREMIQNSLDAVRLQVYLARCACSPTVSVHWNSNDQVLEITDNGTGMTQDIIEQNFLRVGASRYQESSFRRENPDFSPISRFGIGVLSTFMVSDEVQVITCSLDEESGRQISLRSVHGQYLIRLINKDDPEVPELIRRHGHGTVIRIRVRRSVDLTDVLAVVNRWVVIPQAEVLFSIDDQEEVRIGFQDLSSALLHMVKGIRQVEEIDGSLRSRWGEKIEIRTAQSGNVELAYGVKWSPFFNEWSFLMLEAMRSDSRSDRDTIENQLGIAIEGIRVEAGSPGFPGGDIAAIANVSGKGAPRTNVARTALEKTTELDSFLLHLYNAYSSHLMSEVARIVGSRESSATKASSEIQFLVLPINSIGGRSGGEGKSGSNRLLQKALREVPSVVIEYQNSRKLMSIAHLEPSSGFVTLDSPMIRRLESLLAEMPGTITLDQMAQLAGMSQEAALATDLQRLCSGGGGVFWQLVREEWEPTRISVYGGLLSVQWERRGRQDINDPSRWRTVSFSGATSEVGKALVQYAQGLIENLAYIRPDDVAINLPTGDISVTGLDDFDAVKINSETYILPGSQPTTLEFCDGVPQSERSALTMAIISTKLFGGSRARRRSRLYRTDHTEDIVQTFEQLRASTIITKESYMRILSQDLRIFDISRWDRESYWDDMFI